MILKLDMHYQGHEFYKVYINDNPGLTSTYFTARTNCIGSPIRLNGETVTKSFNGGKLAAMD